VARLKALQLFLDVHQRSFLLRPGDWRAHNPEVGGAHSGYAGQFLKWNAHMEKEAPAPADPPVEGHLEGKEEIRKPRAPDRR